MRNSFSLIVPAAADRPEYAEVMPEVFGLDRYGIMKCVRAIQGLNLPAFTDIYFTILRSHAERFGIDTLLRLQLQRMEIEAKIVMLHEPTASQAETVAETIAKENITGPIFVKDADSYFRAEVVPENGVAVFPLEEVAIVEPRNKSYVAVDDMAYVTNIIEKKVVSNLFSAGGYCFESAEEFTEMFAKLRHFPHIYLSHLIYAMLLDGHIFRPINITDYTDLNL